MGGFGSGKWTDVFARKTSVQMCKEISVKILRRNGFLDGNKAGFIEWRNSAGDVVGNVEVETVITTDIDKTPLAVLRGGVLSVGDSAEQRIELTTTDCNYGKFRYLFVCPVVKDGVYCGNRCAKLCMPTLPVNTSDVVSVMILPMNRARKVINMTGSLTISRKIWI